MSSKKHKGLIRRPSGLMALEQRFMFDGAALADAVQSADVLPDAPLADKSVSDTTPMLRLDIVSPIGLAQADVLNAARTQAQTLLAGPA